MAEANVFVLDTSALLALRGDEAGPIKWRPSSPEQKIISVACGFLHQQNGSFILVWREEGEVAAHEALRLIDSFKIEWVSCETRVLEIVARLEAKGGLSIADSWIAATAVERDAILIHKDPEFAKFDEVGQEFLRQ